MDKRDPRTWKQTYVKKNQQKCMDTLEWLTACLQNALALQEYPAAIDLCNQIYDGLVVMVEVWGTKQYGGTLYTYSFLLAEIAMFGIGGKKGESSAVPLLQIAYNYAEDYTKSGGRLSENAKKDMIKMANMMKDIRRGYSLEKLRKEYSPYFPEPWLG